MKLHYATAAVVWAVVLTLENLTIATAVAALVMAATALIVVNIRVAELDSAVAQQSYRLDDLESREPATLVED